jgi:Icc-related predicted phosphoesterase
MKKTIRIAALGDVHCTKSGVGHFSPIFKQMAQDADIIAVCGDLTDYGLVQEAEVVVQEMAPAFRVPVLAVLGNHDFESGKNKELTHIFRNAGINMLDGDSREFYGVGFVGVKGFGGGFGNKALQPWGEEVMKGFVREAMEEAMKLESGLAKLHTAKKVVIMHYSPVRETVEGEPPEVYPFLGSSRLEDPINRYHVTMALHGHSHSGRPEGRTKGQVPVYNVAIDLLKKAFPGRPPFRIFEIAVDKEIPAVTQTMGAMKTAP